MPEEQQDTAREIMPPIQFFNDPRMAATSGRAVRDFSPQVAGVEEDEEHDGSAPSSDEFDAASDEVNADVNGDGATEDGDDDSPPEETPVEQPQDGDNGEDEGHARTGKPSEVKPAKD